MTTQYVEGLNQTTGHTAILTVRAQPYVSLIVGPGNHLDLSADNLAVLIVTLQNAADHLKRARGE